MVDGLIGIKVGMTQLYDDQGRIHPATVIKAGPCVVVQRKTKAKEGYDAVQVGLVETKRYKADKAKTGHFKAAGVPPTRLLHEFRLAKDGAVKVGDRLLLKDVFKTNDTVMVVGTSKGKGFAGVVKRHHFRGGAATHGSMFHRAPGSIGASAWPSRVLKGMRAAGHMGNVRVKSRNLRVLEIDEENHLLVVRGAVPGRNGGYVYVWKKR